MNKVLFYHLEFPAGGTEKVTINIAKFLSNKNYEIHVMTSNKTQDKNFPYIKNIIEIPNQKSAFDESSAENFLIEYLQQKGKHSDKYIFYTLRFDCSFAAANTIKPQLL